MPDPIRTVAHAGRDWDVVVEGWGKLEAPCPDLDGRLLFADLADDGAVLRLDHDGRVATVAAPRPHVGGIVPHRDGGFVASGHVVSRLVDGEETVLLEPGDGYGFNDLTTDADGNVYVGRHGERPTAEIPEVPASLWRIGADGAVDRCYDGILMTNGMRVSPDGTRLYHNDTLARRVWVSDLSPGELPRDRRPFYEVDGLPDGMAMDDAGAIWIAVVSDGRVVRVTPDGREDLVLETPMRWASAVCFGGDGNDLLVTTFGAPYDPDHTGSVISTRVAQTGIQPTPARV